MNVQRAAHHYLSGPVVPVDVPALCAMVADAHAAARARGWRFRFVDADPFPSFGAMLASLPSGRPGDLIVYAGGSAGILPPSVNLLARALHDVDHVVARAPFGLDGELATARLAAARAPALADWFAAEIVGQAAAFLSTGSFPVQRGAVRGMARFL